MNPRSSQSISASRPAYRLALATLALLSAFSLAACGAQKTQIGPGGSRPQKLSLMLDAAPNANHVGIYEAAAQGDFRQAGIDLQIQTPSDPSEPLQAAQAGRVDVAISSEPQVILERDHIGGTMLSFAAIVDAPLTSIISIGPKRIARVAQLRGKTVGISGIPYETDFLDAILRRAHVPPSSVRTVLVGSDPIPALVSGRVAATFGANADGEAIALRQAHRKVSVIPVRHVGVPSYDQLVLSCNEVFFENHVSILRRFVQAIGRGYAQVRADPGSGVDALTRANPSLRPALQLASVRATLPAFFPGEGKPWGYQFPTRSNALGAWMFANHQIAHLEARYQVGTDQLISAKGP